MSAFDSLWVEKYRPTKLSDVALQDDVKKFCEKCIKEESIPHILFCSAPGSGKTTLAKCLVNELGVSHRYMNASDERGIDAIRENVIQYAQTRSLDGRIKVFILDEMDGLTGDAQRALRNTMEEYAQFVRFILTANYKNRVTKPILSRVQLFEIVPPIKECARRVIHIIKTEGITISADQKERLNYVMKGNYPDLRQIINIIQQNVVNGELKFGKKVSYSILAEKIMLMVRLDKPVNDIRKFIIESEVDFGSNYHNILLGLFEYIFSNKDVSEDKKREAMLVVGRYMESHQQVMDFEINCFCCILQLLKVFN